jgi:hypothetical protein
MTNTDIAYMPPPTQPPRFLNSHAPQGRARREDGWPGSGDELVASAWPAEEET